MGFDTVTFEDLGDGRTARRMRVRFCVDGVCCDTACNDSACQVAGTCLTGTCIDSQPVICTAQDECHEAGMCDPL